MMESGHVIKAASEDDELSMMTLDKFTKILGVETGNMSLLTLPYGGIYLIGGVTAGLDSYLKNPS